MSWSCASWVLRTRTTLVSCRVVSKCNVRRGDEVTYWVIWLAGLAERLGCGIDLLDHLGEVLVELVEPVLQLLGEFVPILA